MPLNADQLEAFWMVVQAGGYHAAAERLSITQSAVTQRIQGLEAQLGQRLFARVGRGVALTDAGRVVAGYCRGQREAEAGLFASLRDEGGGLAGRLAVMAGTAEGRQWLLPAAGELARQHPGLSLSLVLDDTQDGVERLERCQVDLVLGEAPIARRGLRSRRLGATPYGLVAAPAIAADWPDRPDAAHLFTARAVDFAQEDRITIAHLAQCLPGEDFGELQRHFVNDTDGIIQFVRAGVGFSVLPLALVADDIARGDLRVFYPDVRSVRPLYATVPDGFVAPAVTALLAALAACVGGA